MAGNSGRREIALRPVAIHTTAKDVFFTAGLQNLSIDMAIIGGGKNQHRALNIRRLKWTSDMPNLSGGNAFAHFIAQRRTDHGHCGLRIEQMIRFAERDLSTANHQTGVSRQQQTDRHRLGLF